MLETKHHWLPVVLAIYLPVSFFITYGMAVDKKYVEAFFPYISDTGNYPPVSCVFAQLLNMGAILAGLIMYIRYRHIALQYSKLPHRCCFRCLNITAYIVGLLAVLGLTLVANFQFINVASVHLLGAALAFGVGFVYCILQTVITFVFARALHIPGNTICIRWFRILLCVVNFVFLIVFISIMAMEASSTTSTAATSMAELSSLRRTWHQKHVASTISEWIAAVVTVIYFATFYTEFKHFRVLPPQLEYYESNFLEETEDIEEREALTTMS